MSSTKKVKAKVDNETKQRKPKLDAQLRGEGKRLDFNSNYGNVILSPATDFDH